VFVYDIVIKLKIIFISAKRYTCLKTKHLSFSGQLVKWLKFLPLRWISEVFKVRTQTPVNFTHLYFFQLLFNIFFLFTLYSERIQRYLLNAKRIQRYLNLVCNIIYLIANCGITQLQYWRFFTYKNTKCFICY
jgi:hypothetical protein